MNSKLKTKLERIFQDEEGRTPPEEPKKDFRELQVIYSCTAQGQETECLNFSPGPSGKCSFLDDELSTMKICRKEE